MKRTLFGSMLFITFLTLAGCGGGGGEKDEDVQTVAPVITTQPANETVLKGQTAAFSVAATGTAPLHYQWKRNGSVIDLANSANYTTSATTMADNGVMFTVTVTNAAGFTDSNEATLTVINVDRFGIEKKYPTTSGGREWTLPDNANETDPTDEWHPFLGTVSANQSWGEFHVTAKPSTGETRLEVRSPAGKRWWKNIEATWYVKRGADSGSITNWWERDWTIIARGERHQVNTTTKIGANGINTINGYGTPPPDSQEVWPTWPWYPNVGDNDVLAEPALATCYDGILYPGDAILGSSGRTLFEKEITHVHGYAANPSNQGSFIPSGWPVGTPDWVGIKFVLRNYASDATRVHMELWVDRYANGGWVMQSEYDDTENWKAASLDANADQPPYNYPLGLLINWAGPYVIFRTDRMDFDMKWNSIREIDPLP